MKLEHINTVFRQNEGNLVLNLALRLVTVGCQVFMLIVCLNGFVMRNIGIYISLYIRCLPLHVTKFRLMHFFW
jgi:hypothetical protein